MKKTLCELFAGVGGFRYGLEQSGEWETVWFNQWEPNKKNQYAHDCYVHHYGTCLDKNGKDTTNIDIEKVNKEDIPDANLLVGGFPCQSYSVASTLASSKGIEGDKGVLWWSIREILEVKQPPFVLLENVDRLLKSPAKQRGRDFAIILACFRDTEYDVEWRVINASDYGYQQRRKRTFIFAYKNNTQYSKKQKEYSVNEVLSLEGFFAQTFPVKSDEDIFIDILPEKIGDISSSFSTNFENTGYMREGFVFTTKTIPNYKGILKTLGDILETGDIPSSYFIPEEKLYYTDPSIHHCDETEELLPKEKRKTWQYIKGGKKFIRTSKNGYQYPYAEGSMPMIDEWDKPARTILTSEGSFSRTTHLVRDKKTNKIRLLTPIETERIQGFPTDYTKYYQKGEEISIIPDNKRKFLMGNALVVDLVKDMEKTLNKIFSDYDI